jgi:hypothetical protein
MQATSFSSRIIKTELISWQKLRFLQQDNFKELPTEAKAKLKASIIANEFAQPFYVWDDAGSLFCLDGKHRVLILEELIAEGHAIPELLPATFISCVNKKEAAKLVLIYSSVYARITEEGLNEFMQLYEFEMEAIKMETSIAGLTDLAHAMNLPFPDAFTADPKNKPAVMKITFNSAEELEKVKPAIEELLNKSKNEFIISVSAGEI